MDLILTLIADPDGTNMINHTKVFSQQGGSIGRSEENDWVLPDPGRIVSSRHCRIDFAGNAYQLIDTSTNGLFLNEGTNPLGEKNPHKLVDGDIFSMGDYKVRVSLRPPKHDPSKVPEGLGAVDFLDQADKTQFTPSLASNLSAQQQASQFDQLLDKPLASSAPADAGWGSGAGDQKSIVDASPATDPMALFGDSTADFGESPGTAGGNDWDDDWWKDGSTNDHALATTHNMVPPRASAPAPTPPVAVAPTPVSPQVADNPFAASRQLVDAQPVPAQPMPPQPAPAQPAMHRPERPMAQPAPAPAVAVPPIQEAPAAPAPAQPMPAQAPNAGKIHDPAAAVGIAQALGLTDLPVAAQAKIPQQISGMIRETVDRLIDLLRARNSIKNELRVQRTLIQTTDNNPLKFSATADDALRTLFNQSSSAFMTPENAVRDSFDDLSDHQVAVLAGTRAAYKAMLNHFSPARLEARFSQSGSLLASKGAKNWAAYCEHYQALMRDSETTYEDLFGDEFAAAYEKQLTDLKNARALSSRKQPAKH